MFYTSKEETIRYIRNVNKQMNMTGSTCLTDGEWDWLCSTKGTKLVDFSDLQRKYYNKIQTKLAIRYRGLVWAEDYFEKYLLPYAASSCFGQDSPVIEARCQTADEKDKPQNINGHNSAVVGKELVNVNVFHDLVQV